MCFSDLKPQCMSYLTTSLFHWNGGRSPMENSFNRHINLLFAHFYNLHIWLQSFSNWSCIFHREQNMWSWLLVCHYSNKVFRKMPAFSLLFQNNVSIVFLKQPIRIEKEMSARSCSIKFWYCFPYGFTIIRNTFEKWKNATIGFWKIKTKI